MPLHQRACITNAKFIYKHEQTHLHGKLKYFQYRNDRDTHIVQRAENGQPLRRWVDRGLGDNYGSIAVNCQQLATSGLKQDVGARTLVISPQVELMMAIPAERREAVLHELTETTVERWFDELGRALPEYAYVLHRGEVKSARPNGVEQAPQEFMHTHVVLAATHVGLAGRENYPVYKEQLETLHEVGNAEMERIWTRELGFERVQELNAELAALTEALQAHDREQQVQTHTISEADIEATMREIYAVLGISDEHILSEPVNAIKSEPIHSIEDDLQDVWDALGMTPLQAKPDLDWEEIPELDEDLDFDL